MIRVVLVDDLIATGGTAEGAVKLLRQVGAEVLAACFIIDLPELGGTEKLRKLDVPNRRAAGAVALRFTTSSAHAPVRPTDST